jgi:hypothetical protein
MLFGDLLSRFAGSVDPLALPCEPKWVFFLPLLLAMVSRIVIQNVGLLSRSWQEYEAARDFFGSDLGPCANIFSPPLSFSRSKFFHCLRQLLDSRWK